MPNVKLSDLSAVTTLVSGDLLLVTDISELAVEKSKKVTFANLCASMGFATGTAMLFYQDTAPTGWTIENTLDDKLVFVTKGSAAGGQTGGGVHSTGTWTQPDHTLSVAEMPAHAHTATTGSEPVDSNSMAFGGGGSIYALRNVMNSAGGGGAHNHGTTWRPAAYCCIIATKN